MKNIQPCLDLVVGRLLHPPVDQVRCCLDSQYKYEKRQILGMNRTQVRSIIKTMVPKNGFFF